VAKSGVTGGASAAERPVLSTVRCDGRFGGWLHICRRHVVDGPQPRGQLVEVVGDAADEVVMEIFRAGPQVRGSGEPALQSVRGAEDPHQFTVVGK
jgi:hypothetical protein